MLLKNKSWWNSIFSDRPTSTNYSTSIDNHLSFILFEVKNRCSLLVVNNRGSCSYPSNPSLFIIRDPLGRSETINKMEG